MKSKEKIQRENSGYVKLFFSYFILGVCICFVCETTSVNSVFIVIYLNLKPKTKIKQLEINNYTINSN